ncbi:hypothetical protein HPB51_028030 [Rhipicephalus microplus]|uniref:NAD(+) ADP-ribosyltransferase n=1 Tax=Rhipicephalus microplus TaxID=6941 RepID=A0A9J6CYX4_RHIMP|nr:hypothetical protein HPB51_028030 [Rhipicephalus microplus]
MKHENRQWTASTKEDSIVLTDSDNDDPQVISSSDSDDEFVFHPDGSFELRERSAKKSKLEELELTLQEEIVETSTSPDAQLPPVDPQCARQLLVPFLCSNHGVFYNAVLNRTCLKKNQNKFYKMQLVVDLCNNHHYVLFRWGRVGEKGSIKLIPCEEDILKAQLVFEERFYSKTGNRWEVWAKDSKFEKRKGKYVILKVDYSGPKLVSLIFDLKAMKETVVRMKFDVTKFPLGMLTKEQILAGYEALDKIEDCIKRKSNKSELVEACSDFYTCIPHSFSVVEQGAAPRRHQVAAQATHSVLERPPFVPNAGTAKTAPASANKASPQASTCTGMSQGNGQTAGASLTSGVESLKASYLEPKLTTPRDRSAKRVQRFS